MQIKNKTLYRILCSLMALSATCGNAMSVNKADVYEDSLSTAKTRVDTVLVGNKTKEYADSVAVAIVPVSIQKDLQEAKTDSIKPLSRIPAITLDDWYTLNYDAIVLRPNYSYLPLIFKRQTLRSDSIKQFVPASEYCLDVDRDWLNKAIEETNRNRDVMNYAITHSPEVVLYNAQKLPEPPKEFVSVVDPKTRMLKIEERDIKSGLGVDAKREKVNVHNWLHTFSGSLHFSQSYVSENWYQGGNNNLNVISDMQWNVKLNTNIHKKYLFENTIRYRVGVITTPEDTERRYSLSDDYFQWNTQVGIKAIKKWYYSATMQFKTQLFNNYQANSNSRRTSFLSPAEMNLGAGITFSNASKDGWRSVNLQISPVSYNLKYCLSKENPAPQNFGIKEGHKTKHDVGSKIDLKFNWKFNQAIRWETRVYAFTNYKYVQGDWQNTFNFNVTSNLTTTLNVHLRYDKSAAKNEDWDYWQLKEILSFGLAYRFATD